MKKYVLDANALLDLVEAGPGFQKVEHLFETAIEQHSSIVISVLNWGEVFYLLWQRRRRRNGATDHGTPVAPPA